MAPGCTSLIQFHDVYINKPFKAHISLEYGKHCIKHKNAKVGREWVIKNCADGVNALDRELIPAGFGKLVFPPSVRRQPTLDVPIIIEILPVEESAAELDQLMDDLALFEPELVQLQQPPCHEQIVDDDEVAPPQEAGREKRTDGIRIVGRLGFPMVAVTPSPTTEACVYCGKIGDTRQCQAPGCACRFHHFCVIEAKGEDLAEHKFCDLH